MSPFGEPIFGFDREVIDATHDLVCAYEPQVAFYGAAGAEHGLENSRPQRDGGG